MTTIRAALLAAGLTGLLAGCEEGSGGSDSPPTFAELDALGNQLDDEVSGLTATDPALLPGSGSATYRGVIGITTELVDTADDPELMLGELTLTADFGDASDPISGQATNFVGESESRLDGTLTLSDSELDRDSDPNVDPTYTASIAGALTNSDDDTITYDGIMEGAFVGDDHGYTFGFVGGDVGGDLGDGIFSGGYIAER